MLSISDAWIKAAVEQKTLKIVYVKANSVQETIREVAPSMAGRSEAINQYGLWGFCYLRDQVRCFKPERVWKWAYVGNSFQPQEPVHSELVVKYRQKQLQSYDWNDNLGEDFGYQQFVDLEKGLILKALRETRQTLIDQQLYTHPLVSLIDQYLDQPNQSKLKNSDLIPCLTIYLEEAITHATQTDQKILEIIKQRIRTLSENMI